MTAQRARLPIRAPPATMVGFARRAPRHPAAAPVDAAAARARALERQRRAPWEGGLGTRARRIIVVGGGRGGVGKTLLAVNLGVYFAQLGREVVVCDADPFGSNLHAVLGLQAPPLASAEALERGAELVSTTVPGLRILPTAYDPITATPVRPSRGAHAMRHLAAIEARLHPS